MSFDFKLSIKTFNKTQFMVCAAENFTVPPPSAKRESKGEEGGRSPLKHEVSPLSLSHIGLPKFQEHTSCRSGRRKISVFQNLDLPF